MEPVFLVLIKTLPALPSTLGCCWDAADVNSLPPKCTSWFFPLTEVVLIPKNSFWLIQSGLLGMTGFSHAHTSMSTGSHSGLGSRSPFCSCLYVCVYSFLSSSPLPPALFLCLCLSLICAVSSVQRRQWSAGFMGLQGHVPWSFPTIRYMPPSSGSSWPTLALGGLKDACGYRSAAAISFKFRPSWYWAPTSKAWRCY